MDIDVVSKAGYSIIGTLVTILLTYIASKIINIDKSQISQEKDLALVKNDMNHIKKKVDDLHKWRDEQQNKEFEMLHSELDRYKRNV